MGLTLKEVLYTFEKIEKKITYYKQFLNELDAIIGDGDHGTNLSKGFKVAKEKVKDKEFKDWGDIGNARKTQDRKSVVFSSRTCLMLEERQDHCMELHL